MRRATVTKHTPTPARLAADRQRRAAAAERADAAVARLTGDLTGQPLEFRVEVYRATIRAIAVMAAEMAGTGRALGVLSGAAAQVCPAYRETRSVEAEALFRKGVG